MRKIFLLLLRARIEVLITLVRPLLVCTCSDDEMKPRTGFASLACQQEQDDHQLDLSALCFCSIWVHYSARINFLPFTLRYEINFAFGSWFAWGKKVKLKTCLQARWWAGFWGEPQNYHHTTFLASLRKCKQPSSIHNLSELFRDFYDFERSSGTWSSNKSKRDKNLKGLFPFTETNLFNVDVQRFFCCVFLRRDNLKNFIPKGATSIVDEFAFESAELKLFPRFAAHHVQC